MMPSITLDLKKSRIRIHKQTLNLMNEPHYVIILINPEHQTIGLRRSHKVPQAHHIISSPNKDCELYSKELFLKLSTLSPHLHSGASYRIDGIMISESLAVFDLSNAYEIPISNEDK